MSGCKNVSSFVPTHAVDVVRIDPITTFIPEILHSRRLNRLDIGQTSGSTEVQPVLVPPIHLVLVGRTLLGLGVVSGSFSAKAVGIETGGISSTRYEKTIRSARDAGLLVECG